MSSTPYKLSFVLGGHSSAVQDLAVGTDGSIVSISNKTAILWKSENYQLTGECIVMEEHNSFLNCVCIISSTEKYPNGLILTGTGDGHIYVYNFGDVEPVLKFRAHESVVCALKSSITDENCFFSSSWDKTTKMWNLNDLKDPERTYTGHARVVWRVADMPNGLVVTGSIMGTITVYLREGEALHSFKGHTGCIRDITALNENEFLTCANDGIIKRWSAQTGECLDEYHGHSSYVYNTSVTLEGQVMISSGQDKTVRIWKDGKLDQTIDFPTPSIWCVKFLRNNDIICGASDGFVRIFTTNPERYANDETMQKFNEASIHSKQSVERKFSPKDIQGQAALWRKGTTDGQTILVHRGVGVKAYSWSQSQSKWIFKRDIENDNPTDNLETLDKENQYDHYFTQYLQNRILPMKIPYNNGQDPWLAVQEYLDANLLPQQSLNNLAKSIIYRISAPPKVTKSSECIPMKNYFKLEQGSLDNAIGELKGFVAKSQRRNLLDERINLVAKLTTDEHEEAIALGGINYLISLLSLPRKFSSPVLVIARFAVLQKYVNDKLCSDQLLGLIKRHLQKKSKNQMLTFCILANMFQHEKGESLAFHCKDDVMNVILAIDSFVNKPYQIAVSTYVSNLAVALSKTNDSVAAKQLFNASSHLLKIFEEPKAIYRLIMTLGTLLTVYPDLAAYAKASTGLVRCFRTFPRASGRIHINIARVSRMVVSLIY